MMVRFTLNSLKRKAANSVLGDLVTYKRTDAICGSGHWVDRADFLHFYLCQTSESSGYYEDTRLPNRTPTQVLFILLIPQPCIFVLEC